MKKLLRKFNLYNNKDEKINLTSAKPFSFLAEPGGLGFLKNIEYHKYTNTQKIKKENYEFEPISGSLVFLNYSEYNKFAKFIIDSPLKLEYNLGFDRIFVDVLVSSLEKTEFSEGYLNCPIVFERLSFFYKDNKTEKLEVSENGGKQYNYIYDYNYSRGSNNFLDVVNKGDKPTHPKITIIGPVLNPVYEILKGDKIISSGKIFIKVEDNEKIVIDSEPFKASITLQKSTNSETIEDIYYKSDWDVVYSRFVELSRGQNRVRVKHEGLNNPDIYIKWREYYVTF